MNLAARVIEVFAEHGMDVDMAMIRKALASKAKVEPIAELQEGFTRRRSMNHNAKLYGIPPGYARQKAAAMAKRLRVPVKAIGAIVLMMVASGCSDGVMGSEIDACGKLCASNGGIAWICPGSIVTHHHCHCENKAQFEGEGFKS